MGLLDAILTLDYKGILAEYVIHNSLDKAITFFKDKASRENNNIKHSNEKISLLDFKIDESKIEDSFCNLVVKTFNDSKDITFRDLDSPKNLIDAYIDTHFYHSQRRYQVENLETKRVEMKDVFNNCESNLIVLGDLGAGKTTLTKKLCQGVLNKEPLFEPSLVFPILIRLREINSFKPITEEFILFEFILQKLGFLITEQNEAKPFNSSYILNLKKIVSEFLDNLQVLILLDGFDEINSYEFQRNIIEEIEILSSSIFKTKLIVTSRTVEFQNTITNSKTLEIAPLNDEQIEQFITHYISDVTNANKFKEELYHTPYFDTSRKPLALAHLCAIYERYGKLPPKPKSIYKKIVSLYIEEWDTQRRIDRVKEGKLVSEYNNLSNDRKFEFLTKFAFTLTTTFDNSFIFTENDIAKCYNILADEFDLPFNQSKLIVNEIEGHSGLIMQSSNDTFEFSHKSIHEYLSAEYISRMGTLPRQEGLLLSIPNELAIANALSSDPNSFLVRLVLGYLNQTVRNGNFINVFLGRLCKEKPDFRYDPILGVVILYIYTIVKFTDLSKLNKQGFIQDGQIETTIKLLQDFIKSNTIIEKSLKELLEKYYSIDTGFIYKDKHNNKDETFERIRKIKDIDGYKRTDGFKNSYQPEILVISKALI